MYDWLLMSLIDHIVIVIFITIFILIVIVMVFVYVDVKVVIVNLWLFGLYICCNNLS